MTLKKPHWRKTVLLLCNLCFKASALKTSMGHHRGNHTGNHTLAVYDTKHLPGRLIWNASKEPTLKKPITPVFKCFQMQFYITNHLHSKLIWNAIKEPMLDINHKNVMYVTKDLHRKLIWNAIKAPILEKTCENFIYVTKDLHRECCRPSC